MDVDSNPALLGGGAGEAWNLPSVKATTCWRAQAQGVTEPLYPISIWRVAQHRG